MPAIFLRMRVWTRAGFEVFDFFASSVVGSICIGLCRSDAGGFAYSRLMLLVSVSANSRYELYFAPVLPTFFFSFSPV